MNEVVERVVRADIGRLLHNEYPRKAICIDCLAAAIPAGSPPFAHIEIRRAVREIRESPGSLNLAFIPVPPLQGGTGVPRLRHTEIGSRADACAVRRRRHEELLVSHGRDRGERT